jgi:hypothetical protein
VFNPLEYSGIALDRQTRDWHELSVPPIDPEEADPYTRCRVVAMTGVEGEAMHFDHQIARDEPDPDLRRELGFLRHLESQQQRVVNGLLPAADCLLEAAIEYEEASVEVDAWVARTEPDRRRRQVYECDALEDFDHVYRFADVLDMVRRRRAERFVDEVVEILPDRPTAVQRPHGYEETREPVAMIPLSKLNALTMLSTEHQVVHFYQQADPDYVDPVSRPLYEEISQVEQEETALHESLIEGGGTAWERLLTHEYNECYLYYSFLQQETDPRIRAVWELHLQMELAHLQAARDLLRRFDNREPEEIVGTGVPEPLGFERNKQFLRRLLATRIDPDELGSGDVREAHQRFERMPEGSP